MANGRDEIGVRGSICASDFIVGAGAPGGVRLPWAKVENSGWRVEQSSSARHANRVIFIVQVADSD